MKSMPIKSAKNTKLTGTTSIPENKNKIQNDFDKLV